eukprot:gene10816-12025_t
MEDILLSVSSPPEIDLEAFLLWVDGAPVEEAQIMKIDQMKRAFNYPSANGPLLTSFSQTQALLTAAVVTDNQYRAFQTLEHYLMQPHLIRSQSLCIISPELQSWIIEHYWTLDDGFVRELLNKRFVKSRKDLEDISESTGLNLRRITRQLDNIKRIYATFEDLPNLVGNIYNAIAKNYLLSARLTKRYTCITFLLYSKFTLTTKRRMQRIACPNLEHCAGVIMVLLCLDSASFFRFASAEISANLETVLLDNNSSICWNLIWKLLPTVDCVELDKELLANLRTLRTIYSGEALDHGCLLIRQSIGNQLSKKIDGGQSSLMLGGSKLRNIVKSLLQLGANLAQSREYRDLLEDILTKVVEPLEEANLAAHEMSNFLAACYLLIAELPEKSPAYGSALSTPMTSARISSQHAYFHHTSSVGSINEAAATGQAPPASPYVTSTGSLGPSSTTVTSGSGTENLAAMNSSAMPQGGGQTLSSAAATTLSTINGPLQGGSNNPMISANASSSSGSSVTASGNINANANASSGSQLSISTNFYPNASVKISNRNDILKKDWLRFIAFVKLSVFQLMGERK